MNSAVLQHLVAWSATATRFLVDQSIFSTMIFIPVLLLTALLRRRSPRLLLGLWMLVLVRLLLPPSFTLPTSLHRLWLPDGTPWPGSSGHSGLISLEEVSITTTNAPLNIAPADMAPVIVVLVWLAGIIVLLRRHLGHMVHHRRFLSKAEPVQEAWINELVQAWQHRLRLYGRYRLLTTDSEQGPFVSGFFAVTIHVPRKLVELKDSVLLECVLAHELAHIKRRDYLLLPLQALVQVLYFFNPLVWIAASRINLLRECACDSLVLEKNILAPQTYAAAVIRALKITVHSPRSMAACAALGYRSNKFRYRIEHMKGDHTMSRFVRSIHILFLMLVSFTMLPMAQEKPENAARLTASSPAGANGLVLVNPLSVMKINLGFGPARHPYTGEMWHHQGLDVLAKSQAEVHACAAGKVIEAVNEYALNKGAGRYMTLQHENGYASRYTHLHSIAVKQGDTVKAGEIIGKVGTTGLSTGPHLHFELWLNGKPIDPAPYLQLSK